MSPQPIPAKLTPQPTLIRRCRELGLSLLSIDAAGRVIDIEGVADAPLEQALVRCGVFTASLRREAARWNEQGDPTPGRAWPGCPLIPVPIQHRRRRVGYHVALMLTGEMARSDHLPRLCDRARLDRRAMADRLKRNPAGHPAEIARLAAMLNWMARDLSRADQAGRDVQSISMELGDTYEELGLVYELSDHMTVRQDTSSFIRKACEELHQVAGLRWVALQLDDHDKRLDVLKGETFLAGMFSGGRRELGGIGRRLIRRYTSSGPVVIDNIRTLNIPSLTHAAERAVIAPVVLEDRPIAVLIAADKLDGAELSSVEAKLVQATAQHLSVFLENAMLYEDVQDMFTSALRSLVSAIDAKDTYTRGHSERVAWLSRELARARGFSAPTVERIYLSALVHDVGKIGVPEAVLCKPGRLTDQEFDMIRAHPAIGERILRGIRQMNDLLPGVLHHHEKFDGTGYPDRLAGWDIPLFGRLICIADSFDAMSSSRTYRGAMRRDRVLEEIRRCAGTQFDPDLVKVFLKLDFTPYERLVLKHQSRDSPLAKTMRRNSA